MILVVTFVMAFVKSAHAQAPLPPDPETGVVYPQANGFIWWMPNRFGNDANSDGIIDYSYDPAFVRAKTFTPNFNGCTSANERLLSNTGATANRYRFAITGNGVNDPGTFGNRCKVSRALTEGTYTVTLDVQNSAGTAIGHWQQLVTVEDRLIVSIGDSFGSGEGNPDIPQKLVVLPNGMLSVAEAARWVDNRCHRSATAGPAQAALELELSDPHSSVTFTSLACSGATISTPDPDHPENGTGLLGPFMGIEPDPGTTTLLPPQVDQLREIVGTKGSADARSIDSLIISIGGNDLQFVPLIMKCTLSIDCHDRAKHPDYVTQLEALKTALPDKYDALAASLSSIPIDKVYLTEYPNLTLQDNGQYCGTNSTWWNETMMLGVTQPELRWMFEQLLTPLNHQLMPQSAFKHGWTFIGGIETPFGVLGQPGGHGYCANDTWLRRSSESVDLQGPLYNRKDTKGTLHPNARGHQVYKERIFAALSGQTEGQGPTYALSLHSEVYKLTSVLSPTGWLMGSCSADNRCSSTEAVMKVVIQDPDGVNWSSVKVDGMAGCGFRRIVNAQTYEWHLSTRYCMGRTGQGMHHVEVGAVDLAGNASVYGFDLKVDWVYPVAEAITSRPPDASGFYGSPVDVTINGQDAPGIVGSGISHMVYQVDDGPWQSGPAGTKVRIGTTGIHTIRYHAVDIAGRTSGVPYHNNENVPKYDIPVMVKLDLEPPGTAALVDPAPGPAGPRNQDVTVNLSAWDGPGAGVEAITYSATGAQATPTTVVPSGLATVVVRAEGFTTITYSARDKVGNSSRSMTVLVFLDKTPPAVQMTVPTEGGVFKGGLVTLSANASDNRDLARVEFLVDGMVVANDTIAPFTVAINLNTVPDGTRVVGARAVDRGGNTTTSSRIIYNSRGADTLILNSPPRTSTSRTASFTFNAWDGNATFECSLDGAAFAACVSPKGYTALAERSHTFRVRSRTSDGTVDSSPALYTWVIDPAPPARTTLLSATSTGVVSSGDTSGGINPASSYSGRYIAFQSAAVNLVAADWNAVSDIFVRDRDLDRDGIFDEPGTTSTTRVSVSRSGTEANGASSAPDISGDGRYITFRSDATNLVQGDTNGKRDVFVYDRVTRATTRISVASSGAQGINHSGGMYNIGPSISANGRYVAFESMACNFVGTDENGDGICENGDTIPSDIFVHDRQTAATVRVSLDKDGAQANDQSDSPSISADGRYVAFRSAADDLIPDNVTYQPQAWVHDRDADADGIFDEVGGMANTKVSISASGTEAGSYGVRDPIISGSGRYVVFSSSASNLVPGDTGLHDVFMVDRDVDGDKVYDEAGTSSLRRVSVNSESLAASGDSGTRAASVISDDGRFVVFQSFATNLTPNDTNPNTENFVRDLHTGLTSRISMTSTSAPQDFRSEAQAISGNGGVVVWVSQSNNLVPEDKNGSWDLYATRRETVPPDTMISSGSRFYTNTTTASFTWASSELGSTFSCSLDGAPYAPCSSPRTYTGLVEGGHIFQVRATDIAGNVDPTPATREWTLDLSPPVSQAPVHSFPAPAQLGTSTVPVRLSLHATDTASGIIRHQLLQSINGGAFTDVGYITAANSTIRQLTPGATYQFQVRAQDGTGKWSSYVTTPRFTPTAYQEHAPAVAYAGTWISASAAEAFGGALKWASLAGARVGVQFQGSQIAWVSSAGPDRGKAEVWLDGIKVDTIDLHSATVQPRQAVYTRSNLDLGQQHTLEVRVLGTRSDVSTGTRVDVDAFAVIR